MQITTKKILNNGIGMPVLGLGVFKSGAETYNAVRCALDAGYRHIDTAMIYENEDAVGRALKDSGVPRGEIFLTTKLWTSDIYARRVKDACRQSMQKLGTDYLDLYLIHWAVKDPQLNVWAYKEMETLFKGGVLRAIGTSNHLKSQLDALLPQFEILPAVSQIEIHPYLVNEEEVAYCRAMNIAAEAWSPLARGRVLQEPALAAIAETHKKTPAQVVIRWHLQRGLVVIPKSVTPARIAENANVFDFSLTENEMQTVAALNKNMRTGSNPLDYPF